MTIYYVPGTALNALHNLLTESLQQPCKIDAVMLPIV